MSLFNAALLVSLGIAVSVLIPHYWPGVRAHSKTLMLIGTVVLLAFVAFDLVPEMVEIGGTTALVIMGVSWLGFSAVHSMQGPHDHDSHHGHIHKAGDERKGHSISALLGSMILHCISGGMLLVTSYEMSTRMASAVLMSLIGHKAFEAISVSSLLIDRVKTKKQLYLYASLYALSFPFGVLVTVAAEGLFASSLSHETVEYAAMVLTSVAIGSLLGCLLQDFLLPSLRDLKRLAMPVRRTM